MAELFSEEWVSSFMEQWNADSGLTEPLSKIEFNSVIAYGFEDDVDPLCYIDVQDGSVVSAGSYDGEEVNWDLRATQKNWEKWMKKPPGMMGLGVAYTTRKLIFNIGDYAAMIKDPRMAKPFIRSFSVMGSA